jgi:hemoglobin
MTTPYEAIGGEPAVRAVISSLYDELFEDPMVGFLFRGRDKARIVAQQVALTCSFLGGPQRYEGVPLPDAHAGLPLLPGHFDRRRRLLELAMDRHGVPPDVRSTWLRVDDALRGTILAAGQGAREKTHLPT